MKSSSNLGPTVKNNSFEVDDGTYTNIKPEDSDASGREFIASKIPSFTSTDYESRKKEVVFINLEEIEEKSENYKLLTQRENSVADFFKKWEAQLKKKKNILKMKRTNYFKQ